MVIAAAEVNEPEQSAKSANVTIDSRDAVTAWILENLVWILGLIPVLLSAIRIYAVAGGDEAVLRALVDDLDVIALFLATVLPVLPYYWFFLGVVLLDSSVFRKARENSLRKRIIAALAMFAIGGFMMQWSRSSISLTVILCIVMLIFMIRAKFFARGFPGVKIGLFLLVASVVLVFAAVRYPWIPAELITLEGEPVKRGYVLSESDSGLTIMWRGGGLQLVDAASVKSRQFCTTEKVGPSVIFSVEAPDVGNSNWTKLC